MRLKPDQSQEHAFTQIGWLRNAPARARAVTAWPHGSRHERMCLGACAHRGARRRCDWSAGRHSPSGTRVSCQQVSAREPVTPAGSG